MNENELLKCPFCGDKPRFLSMGTERFSCIVLCFCCGHKVYSSEIGGERGKTWNNHVQMKGKTNENK